jgi:hypothetical protein
MMYGFGIGEWTVWACNISGFVLGVSYLLVYPFYWKTKEVVDFGNHAAKKNSSTLDTKDIECAPNVSLYKSKQVPIYRRQFIRQTVIVVLTIVIVFVLFSVLPEKNKGPAFWLKNEDYELEDSDAAFPLLVEAIGWGSACTSILLSIHPLVVLHEVIMTNNVDLMGSQTMQWATLAANFLWLLQSLLYVDSMQIFVETCTGTAASTLALLVRFNIWFHGYEKIEVYGKVDA